MNEGWKCRIRTNDFGMVLNIYITRKISIDQYEILRLTEKGNKREYFNSMDQPKPTMTLSHEVGKEIALAIAEGLDDFGIKTNKDAKTEGILEATRTHLDDMRKLVFKGK